MSFLRPALVVLTIALSACNQAGDKQPLEFQGTIPMAGELIYRN